MHPGRLVEVLLLPHHRFAACDVQYGTPRHCVFGREWQALRALRRPGEQQAFHHRAHQVKILTEEPDQLPHSLWDLQLLLASRSGLLAATARTLREFPLIENHSLLSITHNRL